MVIASLLLVGVVSHTPLRHVVQVAPAVVVAGLAFARHRCARVAAMVVFAFWLFCMTLIWLFLLGIARVVTGRFTGIEVVLTLVLGLASISGLVAAVRVRDGSTCPARLATFVVAAALQIGAMWLSLQPMLANR